MRHRRSSPRTDLIGGDFDLGERPEPILHDAKETDKLELQLKLVPSQSARRRVTATLVPWVHADRLRKLVYALPPTMLAHLSRGGDAEGLFVVGDHGIDGLPIGEMFQEAAPSIFVPLGIEFLPRVGAEVLTDHVGGVTPLRRVSASRSSALRSSTARSRRSAGARWRGSRSRVRTRDVRLPPPRATMPATVVNEELAALPLWGFRLNPKAE